MASEPDIRDPADYTLPQNIDELEQHRKNLGLSMKEFSERAGYCRSRWRNIITRDNDPQFSTIQAFVQVLRDADPNGPRNEHGRTAACQIRSDGGNRGDGQ